MFPVHISPSSAGSLAVAVVALFFAVFQGWVAFKRPEFNWNAWGAAMSGSVFLYATSVFVQFNAGAGHLNHFAELIQYSSFLVLIHSAYGFTFAYLALPSKNYHHLVGSFHFMLLLILWATNLVVRDGFVHRDFLWLPTAYIEPELGPLGSFYLLYCVGAGIWGLKYWFQHRRQERSGANAFIIGFCIWAVLGAHDVIVTLGVQSVQFLMVYGFLGFSTAVMTVTIQKYIDLFKIAEDSKAQLQQAHGELEMRVAERTRELTELNQKMNRENIERRRVEEALAASEATMRKVIDLVPHFIFAKNRNGRFIFANQAVAEAYGTTVEHLTGKTDANFNPNSEEVSKFLNDDLKVMASGQPIDIAEESITDASGNKRLLHTIKIPFSLTNDSNDAILGVCTDITARKRAEKDRVELEAQLLRARKMEALGTLAGGVAHDLNNILSGVVSYPELLLMDTPADSHYTESLLIIKESGENAAELSFDEIRGADQTILVIDDVKEQRAIASAMLKRLGYRVDTVSSGEEALHYIEGHSPEILVLDMIMDPGIDGLETYRRIIRRCPGQKAIIASGFSETERVLDAQRLGAGIYIRKPYTIETIGMAIKDELSREAPCRMT